MRIRHLLAFHGHFGAGDAPLLLMLLVIVAAVLVMTCRPDKNQTK